MRSVKAQLRPVFEMDWAEGDAPVIPVFRASEALDAFCYSYIIRIKDKINGH